MNIDVYLQPPYRHPLFTQDDGMPAGQIAVKPELGLGHQVVCKAPLKHPTDQLDLLIRTIHERCDVLATFATEGRFVCKVEGGFGTMSGRLKFFRKEDGRFIRDALMNINRALHNLTASPEIDRFDLVFESRIAAISGNFAGESVPA